MHADGMLCTTALMRQDVAALLGIEEEHSHRQSGDKHWGNIHVWMFCHDCSHDHVDDFTLLERLGRQVLLLLLLGLPILCYLLLQADPAFGKSYMLICSNQQQVLSVAATVLIECIDNVPRTALLCAHASSISAIAMCTYILFCRASCSFLRGSFFVFWVRILFRCAGIICCCMCDLQSQLQLLI